MSARLLGGGGGIIFMLSTPQQLNLEHASSRGCCSYYALRSISSLRFPYMVVNEETARLLTRDHATPGVSPPEKEKKRERQTNPSKGSIHRNPRTGGPPAIAHIFSNNFEPDKKKKIERGKQSKALPPSPLSRSGALRFDSGWVGGAACLFSREEGPLTLPTPTIGRSTPLRAPGDWPTDWLES